ncbi:MAG TPA: HD domain-containing phosphohydrolase [Candidatus Binatia bacterium]|nr:HD domain-containing phosphohydrolase [Candidatus Binatia bacterium]
MSVVRRAPRITDLIRRPATAPARLPASPPEPLDRPIEEPPAQSGADDAFAAASVVVAEPAPLRPVIHDDATDDYRQLEQWLARLYRNAGQGRFDPEGIFDDAAAIGDRPGLIEALFAETFRPREPGEVFARAALNTAIYALRLGAGLGYSKPSLRDIGVAGMLHKIGLMRLPPEIVFATTALDSKATAALREHPKLARDSIRALGRRFEGVAEVVYQSQERHDGSGYPLGLGGEQIAEPALVLGLAAVFDAMTQPRVYRQRVIPFVAVKEILQRERARFPRNVLRQFFNSFSGFPPFSYVRLSSNAVAQVIASDALNPLRPSVVVVRDAAGRRTSSNETIRLVEHPSLHIVGPVSEAEAR